MSPLDVSVPLRVRQAGSRLGGAEHCICPLICMSVLGFPFADACEGVSRVTGDEGEAFRAAVVPSIAWAGDTVQGKGLSVPLYLSLGRIPSA